MKCEIEYYGIKIVVTTEHSASSYGQPVVLIDGEITDCKARFTGDDGSAQASASAIFNQPDVIGAAEFAEMLGISYSQRSKIIRENLEKLGAIKLSRDWMIPREAAEQFATEYKNNPPKRGPRKKGDRESD